MFKHVFYGLLSDVKQGKNIDLAVLLITSIVLAILDIVGIAKIEWVILGIFSILGYLLIFQYYETKLPKSNLDSSICDWHNYNLNKILDDSISDVVIINRVGYNTISSEYRRLLSKVNNGAKVKILLGNREVAASQSMWSSIKKSSDRYIQEWEDAIDLIKKLKNESVSGSVELRVIPVPFAYSAIIVNLDSHNPSYVIAPYSYPTYRDYGWQIITDKTTANNFSNYIEQDFSLAWKISEIIELDK